MSKKDWEELEEIAERDAMIEGRVLKHRVRSLFLSPTEYSGSYRRMLIKDEDTIKKSRLPRYADITKTIQMDDYYTKADYREWNSLR